MHRVAQGRVENQPPIAQLVAVTFHDEAPVGGNGTGGFALLAQVGQQVVHGPAVQAELLELSAGGGCIRGFQRGEGSGEGARLQAQGVGASCAVAVPEGQARGQAGGGGNAHRVVGDFLDAPAAGAEGDDLAGSGFVDHFLVELADALGAAFLVPADEVDGKETAVGDGSTARDGEALSPGAALDTAGGCLLGGGSIPEDARAQLGELVGGVAAGEHFERGVEEGAGQLGVGGAAAQGLVPGVNADGPKGAGGHGLLGEHVQGVGGDCERLEGAAAHAREGHGRPEEVAAVLGIEDAAGDIAHAVAGAAHALQGGGDGGRRGHLNNEVHVAHIDTQFEGAGGHHAAQGSALERLLDEGALFLGDGAVVGAGQGRHGLGGVHISLCGVLLGVDAPPGELAAQVNVVERRGELFGKPAGVHENDRRTVVLDVVDDVFLHSGPDGGLGAPLRPARGLRVGLCGVKNGVEAEGRELLRGGSARSAGFVPGHSGSLGTGRGRGGENPDGILEGVAGGGGAFCGRVGGGIGNGHGGGKGRFRCASCPLARPVEPLPVIVCPAEGRHIGNGNAQAQVPAFGYRFVDDVHGLHAAQKTGHSVGVLDGRGEPDALGGFGQERVQALKGNGQVRPALGGGQVVNLIHDDRGDAGKGVAGGAGEHKVEGFGGGDENVRRVADELAALAGGGVAATHTHGDEGLLRRASGVRGAQPRDAGQRCPQVAFDVGAEGFEGRNVENPRAARRLRGAGGPLTVFAVEGVEGPEEGCEGLARAGGCNDEGVAALADALPCAFLRGGGRAEGAAEPLADGGGEVGECIGHASIMTRVTGHLIYGWCGVMMT